MSDARGGQTGLKVLEKKAYWKIAKKLQKLI